MGKEGKGRGGGKGKYLLDQCQTASGAPDARSAIYTHNRGQVASTSCSSNSRFSQYCMEAHFYFR